MRNTLKFLLGIVCCPMIFGNYVYSNSLETQNCSIVDNNSDINIYTSVENLITLSNKNENN